MRPHSVGHTSMTGRSHITMPPEWMPRCRGAPSQLPGQVEHRVRDALMPSGRPSPGLGNGPHRPSSLAQASCWPTEAQRLGRVAHRRAATVGDHVGHLGGVAAAVALVDVLDDLLPATRLDVEVDVGRPVALGRQEALEQQAQAHGVGLGDPEGVAGRRVGRASPGPGSRCRCGDRTRRCPTRRGSSRETRAARSPPARGRSGPRPPATVSARRVP
jgi:hypothetical protein